MSDKARNEPDHVPRQRDVKATVFPPAPGDRPISARQHQDLVNLYPGDTTAHVCPVCDSVHLPPGLPR